MSKADDDDYASHLPTPTCSDKESCILVSKFIHKNPIARCVLTASQPNAILPNKLTDEDCYSQTDDPYSVTCHVTKDFVYAPCSDLFIPSTPMRPNNFTYFAICTFPDPYWYDNRDFWSETITVDVCENYWDACISDNVLAKYDDTVVYGVDACRKVTDKACGSNRNDLETVPGSEPENTTLGAFDFGPYSTVSQVTVPRELMGMTSSGDESLTSKTMAGSKVTTSQSSASRTSSASPSQTASGTTSRSSSIGIAQVITSSKAGWTETCSFASAGGAILLYFSISWII